MSSSYGERGRKSSPIQHFAVSQRLRVTRDSCGDGIIAGIHGEISDASDGKNLCASFWGSGRNFSRTRSIRIRRALQGHYGQRWSGGIGADEAVVLFDPTIACSASFFIDALGIKRKRKIGTALAEHLSRIRALAAAKKTSAAEPFQGVGTIGSVGENR